MTISCCLNAGRLSVTSCVSNSAVNTIPPIVASDSVIFLVSSVGHALIESDTLLINIHHPAVGNNGLELNKELEVIILLATVLEITSSLNSVSSTMREVRDTKFISND